MARPALLLVDVIRGFLDPAGVWWYPAVTEAIGPLEQLLAAARGNDRVIVHAVQRLRPGAPDPVLERAEPGVARVGEAGGRFREADAEPFPGFEPDRRRPTEILLHKPAYSAFFATDLDLILRARAVDSVVIAGVKTNVCVRATIQDAFAHGYRVVVPREATSSNRPHLAAATLEDVERYFGEVVSLAEALRRL